MSESNLAPSNRTRHLLDITLGDGEEITAVISTTVRRSTSTTTPATTHFTTTATESTTTSSATATTEDLFSNLDQWTGLKESGERSVHLNTWEFHSRSEGSESGKRETSQYVA